jgi:hypothetical protein
MRSATGGLSADAAAAAGVEVGLRIRWAGVAAEVLGLQTMGMGQNGINRRAGTSVTYRVDHDLALTANWNWNDAPGAGVSMAVGVRWFAPWPER